MKRNEIGKKIREMIEAADLTQSQLAQKLGIKQQGISKLISKNSNPSYNTLKKISDVLGKPLHYFFDNSANAGRDININNSLNKNKEVEGNKFLKKDMELLKKDLEIMKEKLISQDLKFKLLLRGQKKGEFYGKKR
jgi:transcriptional regulator with XRE-family HTH domain